METIYLQGAEEVQRAASTISSAADTMAGTGFYGYDNGPGSINYMGGVMIILRDVRHAPNRPPCESRTFYSIVELVECTSAIRIRDGKQ